MFFNAKQDLDYALAFTELYKSEPDPSLREAKCLAMQIPYVLTPIGEDELIVGCMKHGFVGFSPQYGGSYTYYYWDDRVAAALSFLSLFSCGSPMRAIYTIPGRTPVCQCVLRGF